MVQMILYLHGKEFQVLCYVTDCLEIGMEIERELALLLWYEFLNFWGLSMLHFTSSMPISLVVQSPCPGLPNHAPSHRLLNTQNNLTKFYWYYIS